MRVRKWSTRALFALWVTCLAALGGLPAVLPISSPAQAQSAGTGSISGTVTNNDGSPLAGVEVTAEGYWGGWYETTTDVDGVYEFTGLPDERYRIQFVDPAGTYAGEYYDGTTMWSALTWVQISGGGARTGIDATLEVGGTMTGTVLDETGNPFARARVCFTDIDTPSRPCVEAASDGSFSGSGFATGNYIVWVNTWEADGTFRALYYPGVHEWGDHVKVPVTIGQTTSDVDLVFDRTLDGTVEGRVVNQDDEAFEYSEVCLHGTIIECVEVDEFGRYKVGLLPGDYEVMFRADHDRLIRYHDGTPGGTTESDDAVLVSVTAGTAVTEIDAIIDVTVYGTISGTVLQQDGTPFEWATVCADGPSSDCTEVNEDGSYEFHYLLPGEYLIRFATAPEGTIEYYDGVTDPDLATLVTVVSGGSVTGIDAQYPEFGFVEGEITGPDGSPVEGAMVGLFGPDDTWLPSHLTETDAFGYHFLGDVPPGSYRVMIVPPAGSGLATTWHVPGSGSATIEVHAHDYTVANQELLAAGSITGTLVDPSGSPVGGATVRLRPVGSPWVAATTVTAVDGSYEFEYVEPDDYFVRYLVSDQSPVSGGWYDGVDSDSEAQVITVGSGAAVTADQVLRWARSLSGTITGPGAEPVAGAVVRAYQATDGIVPTMRTETAADGTYTLANLPRGEYRIQVTPPAQSGLLVTWFDGANRSTARAVVIGDAGHQVVDVELAGS